MNEQSAMHKLGNKNFTLLSRMLDLESARQRVISQNIANVDTPNYRRRTLDFYTSLRQAMDKGNAEAYSNIQGYVKRPNTTAVRNNGNNVDIDMEMRDLNTNALAYEVYTSLYNKKSTMIKTAIRGGR